MKQFPSILMLTLGFAGILLAQPPSNSITISDTSGAAQANRPFTISRVFAQGEISHFPQARLQGALLPTQADIKTRWPDGSVQHAMVSFLASTPKGGSLTVDFVDQPTGNNANPLNAAQMLSSSYDFGAQIELTNGTTLSANARNMLSAGSFTYWLQGPICTQVIIEDRSSSLRWDLGWDTNKPLHPIFVATFYPGFAGVKVEMIVENDWSTKLEDVSYAVALKTGANLSVVPYTNPSVLHYAKSRWRKTYWSGTAPGGVNIDYNFPYLIYSQAVPTFDLSKVPSSAAIAGELQNWTASDQAAILHTYVLGTSNFSGQWITYMPNTGGRPDIGLFPRWDVRYLYTFAPGLYAPLVGNGEVSGYVPVHIRESATGKLFRDANQDGVSDTDNAFGRALSIDARPTFSSANIGYTAPADAAAPVGTTTGGTWSMDLAHYPSMPYIPYLITGDWYFLEELQFVASYMLSWNNPDLNVSYSRHGNWGFFNALGVQSRGEAWAMRNLAHAAFMTPDGTPEKAYLTQKVNYNIAVKEGQYDITNGAFYQMNPGGSAVDPCPAGTYNPTNATPWCWGYVSVNGRRANPLHIPDPGDPGNRDNLNTALVGAGDSPWMINYGHTVYGHLAELGFPIQAVQRTTLIHLLHQLQDPSYNPFLADSYRIPTKDASGQYFTDWASIKAGYISPNKTAFDPNNTTDSEHGYAYIARAAASFLIGIQDGNLSGANAWAWLMANTPNQNVLNDNPKWALVPRSFFRAPVPPPTPSCDLNGDGRVDVTDVALAIQQALGTAACTADLDQNGQCNVVDIQRVTNAALGQACRLGP